MGCSMVRMCRASRALISWIRAAMVVDLPDPVGPQTRMRPRRASVSALTSKIDMRRIVTSLGTDVRELRQAR